MKKKEKTLYDRLTRPMILLWVGAVCIILMVLLLFENLILKPALEQISTDMVKEKSSSISWFLNTQMDTWCSRHCSPSPTHPMSTETASVTPSGTEAEPPCPTSSYTVICT